MFRKGETLSEKIAGAILKNENKSEQGENCVRPRGVENAPLQESDCII